MPKIDLDGLLPIAKELEGRGWWFNSPNGGWVHSEERTDDGILLPFGTLQEVCDYLGIEAEEYLKRKGAKEPRSGGPKQVS